MPYFLGMSEPEAVLRSRRRAAEDICLIAFISILLLIKELKTHTGTAGVLGFWGFGVLGYSPNYK